MSARSECMQCLVRCNVAQGEKKTSAQLALEREAKRISAAARRAKMHAVHVNISGSFSGSY